MKFALKSLTPNKSMTTLKLSQRHPGSVAWIQALQANPYPTFVSSALGFGAAKLISDGQLYSAFLLMSAILLLFPVQCVLVYYDVEKFMAKHRWNMTAALLVIGAIAFTATSILGVEPASAQFFQKTETWLQSAIKGMDTELSKLIFNVLRALFVIYLGIALVKVVQSSREGEDWQTLARTPLIILVTVTMGDLLGGLITGAK